MTNQMVDIRAMSNEFAEFLKRLNEKGLTFSLTYNLRARENMEDVPSEYLIANREIGSGKRYGLVRDSGASSRVLSLFSGNGDQPEEELRQRPEDQPLPVPGDRPVLPEVIKDLEKRQAIGIKRYGTELYTRNGRNALQDVYEELLDGVQYLKQYLMEAEDGTR